MGLLTLAGEGHGFRKAESRIRAPEAELYFYFEANAASAIRRMIA